MIVANICTRFLDDDVLHWNEDVAVSSSKKYIFYQTTVFLHKHNTYNFLLEDVTQLFQKEWPHQSVENFVFSLDGSKSVYWQNYLLHVSELSRSSKLLHSVSQVFCSIDFN